MWVIFVLVGILVCASCLVAIVFYTMSKEGPAADAAVSGGISSVPQEEVRVVKAPPQKGFSFYRPRNLLKEDVLKDQKPATGLSVTAPSAVIVPPQDPLLGEKLALKESQIQQLEEEKRQAHEKSEKQLQHVLEEISKLREENDLLRSQQTPVQDNGDLARLREENIELKARLEAAAHSGEGVQGQIDSIRQDFTAQLARAQETVSRIEKEKEEQRALFHDATAREAVLQSERDEYQKQAELLRLDVEALQREKESLVSGARQGSGDSEALNQIKTDLQALSVEKGSLEQKVLGLAQDKAALQEKIDFLQYELTKSRAQASGLERICEGSKKRLEDMAVEVRSAQQDKELLAGKVEMLQKSLDALKKT